MPVPTSLDDLSTIPEDNSPKGSDQIGNTLDDFLRIHATIMKRDLAPALTAGGTSFVPAGSIAAETVQAAIEELDTEKFAKVGGTVTGDVTLERSGTTSPRIILKVNAKAPYLRGVEDGRIDIVASDDSTMLRIFEDGVTRAFNEIYANNTNKVWHAGNLDPGAYPIKDNITHVGFASNNVNRPYMRRTSDNQLYELATATQVNNKTDKGAIIAYETSTVEFGPISVIDSSTSGTVDVNSPYVLTGLRRSPSVTGQVYLRARALKTPN